MVCNAGFSAFPMLRVRLAFSPRPVHCGPEYDSGEHRSQIEILRTSQVFINNAA